MRRLPSSKRPSRPSPRVSQTFREHLERLEDRSMPATGLSAYGALPLAFEPNVGQAAAGSDFVARGMGYSLSLQGGQATLSLRNATGSSAIGMSLLGAGAAVPTPLDRLPGVSNYLVGTDPSGWHTDIPTYGRVQYAGVYPGVNLVYYGNQRQLEFDLVLAPGASAANVRLAFQGIAGLSIDAQGNLVLHTPSGDVVEKAPVVYQNGGGVRQAVAGRYVIEDGNTVGFAVGAYDQARPLVIDPVLVYSTYLGGLDSDSGAGIAVDAAGDAYVVGTTSSTDFPTVNPFQGTLNNPPSAQFASPDAFVSKLDPTGTSLLYSTYLGGSDFDFGNAIAVDATGEAYVVGTTQSTNFPTTSGAFQSVNNGGEDAFAVRLNAAGNGLLYSTYLGGEGTDVGNGVATDGTGLEYVVGTTASSQFPVSGEGFGSSFNGGLEDAFVAKLDTNASGFASRLYSDYIGGEGDDRGNGIAILSNGEAYITGTTDSPSFFPVTGNAFQGTNSGGTDAFVSKLNPGGTFLMYSTLYGGTNFDEGLGIAVDSAGNAYIAGDTFSTDLPTANAFQGSSAGSQDAFVAKLDAPSELPGSLIYATYLGGSGRDTARGIAVDASGDAYVTGDTNSTDFPTANAIQPFLDTSAGAGEGGFNSDAFVTVLNASDTGLIYSTYLGGADSDSGAGIAEDSAGSAYVTGTTSSSNFPTVNALEPNLHVGQFFPQDAFVTKIGLAAPAIVSLNPNTAPEGTFGFTLTVTGSGFVNSSVVRWNGTDLPTTFIDTHTLQATVSAALLVEEGTASVTVFNPTPGEGSSGPATFTITDAPLTDTTTAGPISSQEGQSTGPVVVGTFDDANPVAPESDFTNTTIDWGDGQTTTGTVQRVTGGEGSSSFQVVGQHVYADEGTFNVQVTVRDEGGQTVTLSVVTANVSDAPLTDTTPNQTLAATEGQLSGSLAVATFADANPVATPADFTTTTIDWGDGHTTNGQVESAGSGEGTTFFRVIGSHTYAEEGTFTVHVTVVDDGGAQFSTSNTRVQVADAALTNPSEGPITFNATEGASMPLSVAFQDENPTPPLSDFNGTTIDWGDGQTTPGTVSFSFPTPFLRSVSGNHTYAEEGTYHAIVTVRDVGGSSLAIPVTVNVGDAALQDNTAPATIPLAPGQNSGNVVVGTFVDANPGAATDDFNQVSVNWSDGTTSTATVRFVSRSSTGATFNIVGDHTFTSPGLFPAQVTVHDVGGSIFTTNRVQFDVGVHQFIPGQLAAVLNNAGPSFTLFAVSVDHALWRHDDATGWVRLGAPGTIEAISAAPEQDLNPVVFAVTVDHALARFNTRSGWSLIGAPGTIRAVTAGRGRDGFADAYVLTGDGSLAEFRSSGWLPSPIGAPGTILSMSAVTQGRVYVVGADGSVLSYDDAFGWVRFTASGFAQSLDTVDDGLGHVSIFAIGRDNSLWQHEDPTGWIRVGGPGTIDSVTGGQDPSNGADAFALTAADQFAEYEFGRWRILGDSGSVVAAAGVSNGRVYVVASDGSILGHDDTFGWFRLTAPGFAV